MTPKTRSRGGLEDRPFGYREGKDGKVFISWRGQQVLALRGRRASAFISKIGSLDTADQQLAMAKITGNFKRGNEGPNEKGCANGG